MVNDENKSLNGDVVNNEIDTSQDYIATIAELKRTSVSRDEYNKLREENKNLLQTLVEGGQIQAVESKPEVDVQALRNELFDVNCELNNLQFVEKTLELRNALMEKGEPDPFLPVSSRYNPTIEDITKANKVAEAFQSCVDYADGNSEIFTQELMRITNDSNPMPGVRRSR